MWNEDMDLGQMRQQYRRAVRPPKKPREESYVLQMQTAICVLLALILLALHQLAPAAYRSLEESCRSLLGSNLEAEEELVRFAMGKLSEVTNSLQVSAKAALPFTEASIAKKKAPEGSSLESYCPATAMGSPLKTYWVTSGYGWRNDPFGRKSDFHTGVDLAAEEGTLIYPALSGYVRLAGYNSSYGFHLRILHSDGTETLYAHMQYLFVGEGEWVQQTMALGTVGQTGNATGPHLHFELLHNDIRYDPSEALGL